MKDNSFALLPGVIIMFACMAISVCLLLLFLQNRKISELNRNAALTEMSYQTKAITLGYAEFNRTNGSWQWITNR